jgi:hypothetical protein
VLNDRSGSGQTVSPAAALWRGGALPGGLLGALVTAGLLLAGGRAAGSALLGALITLAALSVGPVLMMIAQHWSPPAVMVAALAGYSLAVLLLGLSFVLLEPVAWVSGEHVAFAMVAVVTGWLIGEIRAAGRLRILIYGSESSTGREPGVAGQSGSPASPSEPLH